MMHALALALGAGGRVPFYPDAAVALGFSTGQAHPSLTDALNGTPSLDYDVTGRAWGARCESAGTNSARSTSLQGAAVGAVGSGGSLPTGWHTSNSVSGLTLTVTQISGEEISLTLAGTPAASGEWLLQFEPTTSAVCVAGETWTGSYELQVLSSTGVNSWNTSMIERNSSGTFVSNTKRLIYTQSDTLWQVEQRRTIASGARLNHALDINVTSGVAVNASWVLRRPQLEKSAYRTSYMAATAAADGSRSASALSLKNASTLYASAWSASTGFRAGVNATGTVRQWDDGTDNNRLTLFIENYVAKLEIVSGGSVVETLTLGSVVRWAYNRVTVSASAGVIRASLNGKAARVSTQSPPTTSRDQLALGARAALNGWIGDAEVWTRLFSVGEVASYSVPNQAIFDDFDRANGALQGSSAATGQTWAGVPANGVSTVVMNIASGRAVTADSGVASTTSYTAYDPGVVLRAFRASAVYSTGTGTANATLISNPNGLDDVPDITGRSLHLSFRQDKVDVAYFEGGAITYVGNPAYSSALATDGSTVHHFGYRIHGDAVIVEMADGTLERVLSPTALSKAGRYHTFESFWQGSSAPRSSFVAVHGEG